MQSQRGQNPGSDFVKSTLKICKIICAHSLLSVPFHSSLNMLVCLPFMVSRLRVCSKDALFIVFVRIEKPTS